MKKLVAFVLMLAVVFGVICFEARMAMLLFNWTLTFWQSFGVCALISFVGALFKVASKKK